MAIIGGDQGKAGESKGSGRKADDLRLSCLCLLLFCISEDWIHTTFKAHVMINFPLALCCVAIICNFLEINSLGLKRR